MACSPSGRGVNSVTSTWLALFRARVFLLLWWWASMSDRASERTSAFAGRALERSATFFYAMSIAKRIWPAILIDSKFSTKLHKDYPLRDILRLKRKIPFEALSVESCSSCYPSRRCYFSLSLAREDTEERTGVSESGRSRAYFVWTDLRNNPWVLLAEVSTTTLVLYQSI